MDALRRTASLQVRSELKGAELPALAKPCVGVDDGVIHLIVQNYPINSIYWIKRWRPSVDETDNYVSAGAL